MQKWVSRSIIYSFFTFWSVGFAQDIKRYHLIDDQPPIFLSAYSEQIGHTWTNGTVWDRPLINTFYSLLKEQKGEFVVFDLGAQTGSFSLMAKFFPHSHWYAFEPIQEAVKALKDNISLNGIQNVQVYQVAVSDHSGTAFLKMPDQHSWGLATLGRNVLRFDPVGERFIECITLDSFVETHKIEKVHFMKLDTEGWELYILKGGRNLILRDHPTILMEFNEINMSQCNVQKSEIEQFLFEMGYRWQLVSSEDILCIPISR